jgi:hypothetical protein
MIEAGVIVFLWVTLVAMVMGIGYTIKRKK